MTAPKGEASATGDARPVRVGPLTIMAREPSESLILAIGIRASLTDPDSNIEATIKTLVNIMALVVDPKDRDAIVDLIADGVVRADEAAFAILGEDKLVASNREDRRAEQRSPEVQRAAGGRRRGGRRR
jgi:hypothetical protein